ncbi:MAG: hypothetical protein KIT31_07625 [Deltaproteobacteria bacterium]|nr:hypothetical protein [Deltaproteobacteria bacterium]
MIEHTLTGLDGRNPLGFLAAIGLLRVLDDDAERREVGRPRLAFESATAVAVISSDLAFDAIVELVLSDAAAQGDNRALLLAYTADGELALPGAEKAIRDLKPKPHIAARFLRELAAQPRRASGLAAAWFSELVQDNNGNSKPTAFHFTAGQQTFLEMVEALRAGIVAADVREALLGPWDNTSRLPSLSWDSSVTRLYALRANNPSGERRGSVPAANWLGVLALEAFPVVAIGDELVTTAVDGRWKDSVFRWPLWQPAATFRSVCSLLRVDARMWTAAERLALGITEVMGADISRSDQGGYGSFSPSHVELPAGRNRK